MRCTRCKKAFDPETDKQRRCPSCIEYYREYYAKNKEMEIARHAEWAEQNRAHLATYRRAYRNESPNDRIARQSRAEGKRKQLAAKQVADYREKDYYARYVLKRYGLTREVFDGMVHSQRHCCAICLRLTFKFHVDHDHITQKVRGLLCGNCNRGLGCFEDDLDYLRQAIEYLKRNSDAGHPPKTHTGEVS